MQMTTFFTYFVILIQQYLVPFIFAIGLIHFFFAIVKYFIIGPTEEPVREEGRHYFIKATVFFILGLIIYLAVAGMVWLVSLSGSLDVQNDQRLQRIPDVPTRNN